MNEASNYIWCGRQLLLKNIFCYMVFDILSGLTVSGQNFIKVLMLKRGHYNITELNWIEVQEQKYIILELPSICHANDSNELQWKLCNDNTIFPLSFQRKERAEQVAYKLEQDLALCKLFLLGSHRIQNLISKHNSN